MSSPFNLSRKYNTIAAIIVGALLASVVISILLIRPAWASLKQLGQEVPTAQNERDGAEAEQIGLEKAKSYFDQKQDTVEEVNIAVPIDPQVPQILLVLEELAKDNRVRLTSFVPQQPSGATAQSGQAATGQAATPGAQVQAAPAGDTIEVTANFEGSYSSLINFFYTLERSLRIIDVKSITVTGGSATSAQPMTGSITFTAYYKKVGGSTTAAPAVGAQ